MECSVGQYFLTGLPAEFLKESYSGLNFFKLQYHLIVTNLQERKYAIDVVPTLFWHQQYLSVPGKEEDVSGGSCVEILCWDRIFLELTSP